MVKDAHVMETRSLPILRRRVGDEPLGLDARARLESHLRETEQHAERLRQALRRLGSAPPPVLRSSEPIVVLTQDITSRVFSDCLVIGAIADLAAEQFEVAAYTALIAAAEHAGETKVARLCRLNRGEDEDMADGWMHRFRSSSHGGLRTLPRTGKAVRAPVEVCEPNTTYERKLYALRYR
jgi:ferritin-like metal-binding protein YciE